MTKGDLVLGTFHMDNPGQDRFNTTVDDVRSARRQKEMAELLDKLAAFCPTKIAVEAALKGSKVPQEYESYLADTYRLTPNEIDQIGYVLARRLGHKAVYPVDYAMWMDGRVPAEIGVPRPRPPSALATDPDPERPAEDAPEIYRKLDRIVRDGTILDALRYANSDDYSRADHARYVESLRPDPYSNALYGTTDPVSNWYKRNLRIFTNIYRIAEPGDRVLVIYGSGHNGILRHLAIDSGDFCLVDTAAYLGGP